MRSEPTIPDSYRFKDGLIVPSSYLAYRTGESFFRDAHQYFSLLPPNAKVELATTMHADYKATNAQIQRMLKMDPAIIGELFPAAKVK